MEEEARARARQRAKELRAFFGHLFVYAAVMILLVVIDLADGNSGDSFIGLNWAYWPIFGWGFFVLLNGLQLLAGEFMFGAAWEQRKVEKYMEAERQRELFSH